MKKDEKKDSKETGKFSITSQGKEMGKTERDRLAKLAKKSLVQVNPDGTVSRPGTKYDNK